MKKYYYDNLADALQAMKHGIKTIFFYEESNGYFELEGISDTTSDCFSLLCVYAFIAKKFFIKEESLHLLKPQKNDRSDWGYLFTDHLGGYWNTIFSGTPKQKIAFRNGMYFPQPIEVEDE